MMSSSKKLTAERIKEIQNFPITYDEDSPKLTPEQRSRLAPRYWRPIKIAVSLKLDADVLNWFKSQGKGYQTRINEVLRNVMIHNKGA
jgi:uncharacterized protein (DUF4415 family)